MPAVPDAKTGMQPLLPLLSFKQVQRHDERVVVIFCSASINIIVRRIIVQVSLVAGEERRQHVRLKMHGWQPKGLKVQLEEYLVLESVG